MGARSRGADRLHARGRPFRATARILSAFTVGGEQRYIIDKSRWATLLQSVPAELPSHRDWPQLLGALRAILRWSQQEELQSASDYLRASSARQLLERIRPDLASAGIAIDPHPTAESAPRQLQIAVEAALTALDPEDSAQASGTPPAGSG